MDEALTITEIEERCPSEWILVEDPQTNDALEVLSGILRFHSRDRDEVYRKAVELRPKRYAMLYTGPVPEDMPFILCLSPSIQGRR
jgi:hypothetical protein